VKNAAVIATREEEVVAFQKLQEWHSWVLLLVRLFPIILFVIHVVVVISPVILAGSRYSSFIREGAVDGAPNSARLEHHGVARQGEGNARLDGKFLADEKNDLRGDALQF
jgi:hypothetical protein